MVEVVSLSVTAAAAEADGATRVPYRTDPSDVMTICRAVYIHDAISNLERHTVATS